MPRRGKTALAAPYLAYPITERSPEAPHASTRQPWPPANGAAQLSSPAPLLPRLSRSLALPHSLATPRPYKRHQCLTKAPRSRAPKLCTHAAVLARCGAPPLHSVPRPSQATNEPPAPCCCLPSCHRGHPAAKLARTASSLPPPPSFHPQAVHRRQASTATLAFTNLARGEHTHAPEHLFLSFTP